MTSYYVASRIATGIDRSHGRYDDSGGKCKLWCCFKKKDEKAPKTTKTATHKQSSPFDRGQAVGWQIQEAKRKRAELASMQGATTPPSSGACAFANVGNMNNC